MIEDVPTIAAELGRQLARLARAIARTPSDSHAAGRALQPPFGNLELSDWLRAVQLWREHGSELAEAQPDRACPACGGVRRRSLFQSFDGYQYVDCLDCGTWYIPRVIDDGMFEKYYERCPEAAAIVKRLTDQRLGGARAEADRKRMEGYFSELEPLIDSRGRTFLDVGCGVGHALEIAAERGWRATGIDTSASVLAASRKRGLHVFHPSEVSLNEKFALVSIWETLEHLNDPLGVLSSVAPHVLEEGLLSITVPNVLAIEASVMRQDTAWINGGPGFGTVHINLFRPSSLERLLNAAGFSVVAWDGEYGSNAHEIASYLLGRHRGAWDYTRGVQVTPQLSEDATCILNWVGPVWSVLARQLLLAPAMKVVASKSTNKDRLSWLQRSYVATRRAQILGELDKSYPE